MWFRTAAKDFNANMQISRERLVLFQAAQDFPFFVSIFRINIPIQGTASENVKISNRGNQN